VVRDSPDRQHELNDFERSMKEKFVRKVILMTLVGALPALALAGCGGSEAQDAGGQVSADSSQATEQHSHDADGHSDEAATQVTEQHEHDTDDASHDADESAHESGGHEHDSSDAVQETAQHSHESGDDTHAAPEEHSHDSQSSGGHDHGSPTGSAGDAADVSRTVEIGMDDTMRFTPDSLSVDAGETVRLVIRNNGQIPHEFVIGSMSELLEHAEMMRKMPGMQHAESNMLTLEPGAEGEIIWQFGESGSVDFACLIPGHLEAGMKGVVQVE
jgi:uncharacterized cupredoxin-like copper-binding protein